MGDPLKRGLGSYASHVKRVFSRAGLAAVLALLALAVPVAAAIVDSDNDRMDDSWEQSTG